MNEFGHMGKIEIHTGCGGGFQNYIAFFGEIEGVPDEETLVFAEGKSPSAAMTNLMAGRTKKFGQDGNPDRPTGPAWN